MCSQPTEGSMDMERGTQRLDAASLWYEVGREVQAVALLMRKHQVVEVQRICVCGRVSVHTLPLFGPRCELAGERWVRAHEAMRRVVAVPQVRAVGRASVGRWGSGR